MKYRVGKKQSRVILDDTGHKVAECLEGNEDVAQQICDLLNDKGLVNNLSQHLVSNLLTVDNNHNYEYNGETPLTIEVKDTKNGLSVKQLGNGSITIKNPNDC